MKYCSKCGSEIHDEAVICVNCGCNVESHPQVMVSNNDDTLKLVVKIFLVIGCVSVGWLLIPLIWCIPITVSVFKKLDNNEEISVGLKVCVLLFVNMIAGICMLCMDSLT